MPALTAVKFNFRQRSEQANHRWRDQDEHKCPVATETDTILPPWRIFRYVPSIQRKGHSPVIGRVRKASTRSSIFLHIRLT